MLTYKINVLEQLKQAGYNTNRIRKEKLLGENSLQYLREGKPVGAKALNALCRLLNCQPGDILEYVPDDDLAKLQGLIKQEVPGGYIAAAPDADITEEDIKEIKSKMERNISD